MKLSMNANKTIKNVRWWIALPLSFSLLVLFLSIVGIQRVATFTINSIRLITDRLYNWVYQQIDLEQN
jgi:hypothetical protein